MLNNYKMQSLNTATAYSFFSNEYVLTEEMCAEAELSRMDILFIIGWIVFSAFGYALFPSIPNMINEYFSSPSLGTILELSGGIGIPLISPIIAMVCIIKIFPQKVGQKRFKEQLTLVPSENRKLAFYNEYVEVTGKFKKKLPYDELVRTGETRTLYLLYFTNQRILFVPKSGFHKGTLSELKHFISKRRTIESKIYGIVRYSPALIYLYILIHTIYMG